MLGEVGSDKKIDIFDLISCDFAIDFTRKSLSSLCVVAVEKCGVGSM